MLKTFSPKPRKKQKQGKRVGTKQKTEFSANITRISSHNKDDFLLQAFTTGSYRKFNYTKILLPKNSTNIKA
jgi:hypothetical protein